MDTCVRCGADLGVGRFCLNCGHPIGEPAPVPAPVPATAPTTYDAPPTASRPFAAATPGATPPTAEQPAAAPPAAAPPAAEQSAVDPATTALPVQAADPTPVPVTTMTAEAPAPAGPAWDPSVDLLPYEEVDDPHGDDPLRGRAWIAWVAGAVVLVGLVFVLLQVFASDPEDDGTATDAGASESAAPQKGKGGPEKPQESPEAAAGVGKQRDLLAGATFAVPATAPPTTDFDGNLVAYEASQMHDGNPSTTWRTAGDATGQAVTITLPKPGVVYRVGLLNGYAKQVAGVDWYPNNRRILSVTWGFDDGTTVEQTFAERPAVQRVKVPPVETSTVTITITSVTPPGSGSLGRDYTAISEVSVSGKRAG